MKFEEKRKMEKKEVGRLLAEIGKRLEEKGVLDFGKGAMAMPPSIDVEIEYKEKRDKRKFEIELEWYPQEQMPAMPSLKEIKQGIKIAFNNIREGIENNVIPTSGQFAKFKELVERFERYAKGEAYEGEIKEFSAKVIELERAISSENLADAQRCVESLRATKKSCHKMQR